MDRSVLQQRLESILGTRNVYFQPPESLKMVYPCIRYNLNGIDILHADNAVHSTAKSYQLTLIDTNPDSLIVGKILDIPKTRMTTSYQKNGMNHWVFITYN